MSNDNIRTVGVIGAGTMGQGIAQACASSGLHIILFDVDNRQVARAMEGIGGNLEQLVAKGKIPSSTRDETISRITPVTALAHVKCDLVIEAAIEKLEVKLAIFKELENVNDPESILATNTSSLPITQIASGLRRPDRFAGLHFFNPAPVMKLVEIIRTGATSERTIQRLLAFVGRLSKQPVLAQDSPGFIVNRVARHFYVESLRILEERVCDHGGIDRLIRSSGFRMGPFELMDLIGIDVNFAVTSSLYHGFHQDPKFRPNRIQQQKVDAGHLGKKTGKGFYDYNNP